MQVAVSDIEMAERESDGLVDDGLDIENEAIDSKPLLHGADDGVDSLNDEPPPLKRDYEQDHPDQQTLWRILRPHRSSLLVTCAVSVAVIIISVMLLRKFLGSSTPKSNSHWEGFAKIENWFAFGDSWTDTHFATNGDQPSMDNPLGNPDFPGFTSSNGANYVGYLTAQYNHSFIKAYSMAFSGSTIDAEIDHPMMPWVDFRHQIRDNFIGRYTVNDTGVLKPLGWTSENTLVSMFFGINDLMVFNQSAPQFNRLFESYESLIGELYNASARNFLILNAPPLDRGPITFESAKTDEERIEFASDIKDFNKRIRHLAQGLREKYHDATVFEYDVHDLFERILEDPTSISQTVGYKNTLSRCKEYAYFEKGAEPTKTQLEACGDLQPDQYLWLNSLHISAPAHEAIAAGMEKVLLNEADG